MKKFALALGGGSARGFAHIGVIQFLEENGLKPSKIAGTSMGAIIGSLYALGFSSGEIHETIKDKSIKNVINFNPVRGIFGVEKFRKILEPHLGDKKFSDTKIPLFIVATSLTTGEKKIFSEWSILDAICASIAIPWVFSPYKIGDEYFIDGWMRENLPLSPCEDLPIIASSVVLPTGNKNFKKIAHFFRPLASMYDAFSIMLEEQEKLGIQSYNNVLLIRMLDNSVQYMDFQKWKKLIKFGYYMAKKSGIEDFLQEI